MDTHALHPLEYVPGFNSPDEDKTKTPETGQTAERESPPETLRSPVSSEERPSAEVPVESGPRSLSPEEILSAKPEWDESNESGPATLRSGEMPSSQEKAA